MGEASAAPQPLQAYYQPWHRSSWLAVWGMGTIVFAVVFYSGLVAASLPLTVTGALIALGFFIGFVICYRTVRIDDPVVEVTEAGYHDRRIGRTIPWAEIKGLTRHQPGTQVHLFIEADQPERFVAPRTGVDRFKARRRKDYPVLGSNLAGLSRSGDDIVRAAEAFHAATKAP